MTLRSRDIVTVVPRRGETATGAALDCETGAAATGAFWNAAAALGAAAKTSSLRIRPPIPVPLTFERSTLFSAANLRTIGVT